MRQNHDATATIDELMEVVVTAAALHPGYYGRGREVGIDANTQSVAEAVQSVLRGFDREQAERSGLRESCLESLAWAIWPFVEINELWIYGSRGRGDHGRSSDVDLALIGPVDRQVANAIKERMLDATTFPYFVDVVAWNVLKEDTFRALVLRDHKVLWRRPVK